MLKANYHARSWWKRYYGTGRVEVKDEAKKEIKCATLMDVLLVTFTPPWGREDLECFIYGEISVKIGQSDESVRLFYRDRQHAARIVLKDDSKNFLTLPDLPEGFSPQPFKAAPNGNRIRVTMSLRERKRSKEEDVVVAELKDLEHVSPMVGTCSFFDFTVQSNFCIGVGFFATLGSPVQIQVKIRQLEEEEEEPVPINAEIQVIQNLNYCDCCRCGQAVRTLYNNEEQVTAGNTLKLLRSIVCLPMDSEQFLTILIRPDRHDKDKCRLVDFPFELVGSSFWTNQEGIHTKDVPGTPFSVSIKFLNQSC